MCLGTPPRSIAFPPQASFPESLAGISVKTSGGDHAPVSLPGWRQTEDDSRKAYADPMKIRSRCVPFAVIFCAAVACGGCAQKRLDDLPSLSRGGTLWTGPSGSQVVLYGYGMAVGKTPEALVCEQGQHRDLIERLPADSFTLTSGNELKVIRRSNQTLLQTIDLSRRCP